MRGSMVLATAAILSLVIPAHCVSCHDFANPRSGGLVLAGDREVVFNAAYTESWSKGLPQGTLRDLRQGAMHLNGRESADL